MTTSAITLEELVDGLNVDEDLMPLAMFVANELNDALVHNVALNGINWMDNGNTCGCLVTTAARRAGLDVRQYLVDWTFDLTLPDKLGDKVGIDRDLLASVAFGFTLEAADELASALGDPAWVAALIVKQGRAHVLGSRALLLFREHGGQLLGEQEKGNE